MLRYRVAIMVWTFMLLGAASGNSARLKAEELALEACALAWSYVAATTVNDLADVEIDLVNHPGDAGRPLVSGAASPADMRKLHWLAWAAAIGCAAPLGLMPAGLVIVGLVIGRAYSVRPLRLSYRPYWAPSTLAIAYVVVPYTLGFWSSGAEVSGRAIAIGAGLVALFLARIMLKDFRDREGDGIFGRRSLLLLHGKRLTCALSGAFVALGDGLLSLAFGGHAWPLLVLAQGFFASRGVYAVEALQSNYLNSRTGSNRDRRKDGKRPPFLGPFVAAPERPRRLDRRARRVRGCTGDPLRHVVRDPGPVPRTGSHRVQGLRPAQGTDRLAPRLGCAHGSRRRHRCLSSCELVAALGRGYAGMGAP